MAHSTVSPTGPAAAERARTARVAASRRQVRVVKAIVAGVVLAVALLAGGVLALVTWWAGPLAFVVVAAALWGGVVVPRTSRAEERVLGRVGPVRDADVRSEARFINLVDGLVPSAGLSRPRCLVIDDPTRNALILGRNPRHSYVVVTRGLLDGTSRMELEGVVASALVAIRDGLVAAPTLALALGGARLLAMVGGPRPAAEADLAAVNLTRYPPGLAAAYRRILEVGSPAAPAGSDSTIDRFWLAQPGDAAGLTARAGVLEEL